MNRPSNSFNADEIAAFQALSRKAMRSAEFVPIMRHRGMVGLLKKFLAMGERIGKESAV
jgi:hypothetical protein